VKAIDRITQYLPYFLFCLFVVGFFVLAFPHHGGVILDVIVQCAEPWIAPLKNLLLK
jgi:hypothetical protein